MKDRLFSHRLVAILIAGILLVGLSTLALFADQARRQSSSSDTASSSIKPGAPIASDSASSSSPDTWPSLVVGQVTLRYPPAFASVATLELGEVATDTYGETDYDISAVTASGTLPDAFIVSTDPNQARLSLNDWFEKYIDSAGLLKSSDDFKEVSYPDGRQAFIWTGLPYPAGWNGGLVMDYAVLMSPPKSLIVIFTPGLSQDTDTGALLPGYAGIPASSRSRELL
jgi:hypothetical protein